MAVRTTKTDARVLHLKRAALAARFRWRAQNTCPLNAVAHQRGAVAKIAAERFLSEPNGLEQAMVSRKTLWAALLCTPVAALAATAGGAGNVDIYYVNSEIEAGGGDTDGDGFGVRGMGKITDAAFVYGEYQTVEYDAPGDPELEQIRAGLGYAFLRQSGMDLYGKAELVNVDGDLGVDDTGYGVHGGIKLMPAPELTLKGQVGWIDVDDVDGPEYLVGAAYNITPQWGIFTDYRFTDLEADGGGEAEVKDWRVGGRFNF
jgi:hypothetical protein